MDMTTVKLIFTYIYSASSAHFLFRPFLTALAVADPNMEAVRHLRLLGKATQHFS